VNDGPLNTISSGGLQTLHLADDDAVDSLDRWQHSWDKTRSQLIIQLPGWMLLLEVNSFEKFTARSNAFHSVSYKYTI